MEATYDFAGSVALVTGGASGMGRAIAAAFAAANAHVCVADINEEGGRQTVDAITSSGGDALFVRTDVADSASVQAMVEACVRQYGQLSVAVNAAAIEGESSPLAELDDELFDRIQAVNVRSVYLSMKHEINAMLAGGSARGAGVGGAIVNIASTNSFRPQPHQSAYTASKFAVLGLTKSAAIDYAPKGIRINAICPGAIDTPMLRGAMERRNRDERDVIARLSLLRRFGATSEIAQAALWLCSESSSFTVGHALAVDGGYLAR
jgi:NAD(P)-dependent dehydrogenase (short-subunit alcohol dehydrogenase family)